MLIYETLVPDFHFCMNIYIFSFFLSLGKGLFVFAI